MRPPTRTTRSAVASSKLLKRAPKVPKKSQVAKPKDSKLKAKERSVILSALQKIEKPKLPDDLLNLQRQLPRRSTAEIEEYLNGLIDSNASKKERTSQLYADANLKKWIETCDDLAGISKTCSKTGDGTVIIAHPALAVADIIPNNGNPDHSFDFPNHASRDSTSFMFDWDRVYWFLGKLIQGVDPFEEWSCRCQLESTVILELLEELMTTASDGSFSRQHKFFFEKSREVKGDATSAPYVEQPIPSNVFDSKFLNPFGMSNELCQTVLTKTTNNPTLELYQKLLDEKHPMTS